jgi:hypothetical protein
MQHQIWTVNNYFHYLNYYNFNNCYLKVFLYQLIIFNIMNKIKLLFITLLLLGGYKIFIAIKDFEIGVGKKIAKFETNLDIERQDQVIALMMYSGSPLELQEFYRTSNESECLKLKRNAEENSYAFYKCALVRSHLKGEKITSIKKEIKIF